MKRLMNIHGLSALSVPNNIYDQPVLNNFKCQLCSRDFKSLSGRLQHLENYHGVSTSQELSKKQE